MTQPPETNDARRLELVTAAGRQWTDALTDLGGRNTLLYYKDRRAASGSVVGLGSFEADVAARLAALGITVVPRYGVGGYRVDFAAAHPDDPSRMILAVEADCASYRDSGSVRDRPRKEHLERLGWRVHRLWSTSWFTNPEAELAKLCAAYQEAVAANPPAPPPPPPPGPPPPAPADPANDEPLQHHEPPRPFLPQAPRRPPALERPNAAALPQGRSAQDS